MKETGKKKKLTTVLTALLFTAVLALLLSAAGVTLARYITSSREESTAVAAPFYFTSDKLTEQTDPYTYYQIDEPEGENATVSFTLANFVDKLRCTGSDIQYVYEIFAGDDLSASPVASGSGTLAGGARQTPNPPISVAVAKTHFVNGKITVKATASTPYEKIIYAQFGFTPQEHQLQWAVTDSGSAVVLEMAGGDGSNVVVTWPASLTPDLSNGLFHENEDAPCTATFAAQPGVRYALTFFKQDPSVTVDQSAFTVSPKKAS